MPDIAANPLLKRYLAASALCLLLDGSVLEALSALGLEVHLARLASIVAATCACHYLFLHYVFTRDEEKTTARGQPIPFSALGAAGAVLSYAIFTRLLHVMPHPLDSIGRLASLFIGSALGTACNWGLLQSLLPQKVPDNAVKTLPLVSQRTVRRLLVWGLFAFLMLDSSRVLHQIQDVTAWPKITVPLEPDDPDAWLRLTQVRQWVTEKWANGGFFDHSVRQTNAPFGGITTPWTRPMDALISLFYFFTPHSLAVNMRLMLAATWLPACLGLITLGLIAKSAMRHFNHAQTLGCAALLLLVSVYDYTAPGDADHHGLLSTLWCGVLCLLMADTLSAYAALLLGALLGVMIWVSPEALMLIGVIFALTGMESLFRPEKGRTLLLAAIGTASVATAALFVEMPVDKIRIDVPQDTLSIVYAAFLWFTAAGTALYALVCQPRFTAFARICAAAAVGAGIILAEFLTYPHFFSGPLADVDPFILTGFLPRVGEAQPLFHTTPALIIRVMMEPLLAVYVLWMALLQNKMRRDKLRRLLLLTALLLMTLGMSIVEVRWGYYLQPVAMIAVAALMPAMATAGKGELGSWAKNVPRYVRPYLVLWGIYLVILGLAHYVADTPSEQAWCMTQLRYVVQEQQLQPLLGKGPLVMFTHEDEGGEMQFFTPYHIIGSNYHREGKGLHDLERIWSSETPADAKPVLDERKVDTLLYCPGVFPENSWLHATGEGKLPPWLKPVDGLQFLKMPGPKPLLLRMEHKK